MFKRDRPVETTETILEKLQRSQLENVVMRVNDRRYLVPTATIKLLAWNSIPDMIKDEHSEAARKHATARTGLKALIRPILPELLKKTWGQDVEITPRLNILSWLPAYLLHFLVNVIASKEWIIDVETCDSCSEDTYKIIGISPHTNPIIHSESIPTPQPDHQSVPRRGQFRTPGSADSDEPRGSLGNCGNDRQRQDDHGEEATRGA